MTKISYAEKNQAIGMLRAGLSAEAVSGRLRVSKRTIERLKSKYRDTGTVNDRPRTGRPRKTSTAEDRHIRTLHLRNRQKTASDTARNWVGNNQIGRMTVH